MPKTIVVRPMTKTEQQIALMLSPEHVTYLPGSWAKRFARALAYQAKNDEPCITEKQAEWLRNLAHKYRRQVPNAKLLLDMEAAQP